MGKHFFDGVEVATISDFASENGVSAASVATWVKRAAEDPEINLKAFTQIGPTLLYSVTELMGAKNRFQRQVKPKPVEFEEHQQLIRRNMELCVENAELIAEITRLTANLNGLNKGYEDLQADYDALVKKFDELTDQENYYKRELEKLQSSIISG